MSIRVMKVYEILNGSQAIDFDSDEGIQKLKDLAKTAISLENFLIQFKDCLANLLCLNESFESNRISEFFLEFLVKLDHNKEDETLVRKELVQFLVQNSSVSLASIRLRICCMLKRFFELLNEMSNGEIDDTLFQKLQLCLIERMRDSDIRVQMMALRAASLLQAPKDKYCPITNLYVHFLKHESLLKVRLLVLDLMVINSFTYQFMTNELIYCNCDETRNKIICLIEKKVPNKAINAKLRKFIIKYLIAQANFDLLDRLLEKWLRNCTTNSIDNSSIINFISSLELEEVWYSTERCKYEQICLVDEVLVQTMNRVLKLFNNNLALANRLTCLANIFDDLNASFYFRSILAYLNYENDLAYLLSEVDSHKFYALLVENLSNDSANNNKTLIYFILIDALYYFEHELNALSSYEHLIEFMNSIEYNEPNESLFNLILSKCDEKQLQELVWQSYLKCDTRSVDCVKKNLVLQAIYFSRLSEEDFNNLEWIDSDDLTNTEKNLVEYLIDKFILTNLANVNPQLRALCVRSLGLASLNSFHLAESYVYMMSQMIALEHSDVVIECQKAVYNIIMLYHNRSTQEERIWKEIFNILEKQLDCLSNSEIAFVAFEGFAKLLIFNCKLPNKQRVLTKMLLAYFSNQIEDAERARSNDQRLKECLSCFFETYSRLNSNNMYEMVKLFTSTSKLVLLKKMFIVNVKQMAKYFYSLTSGIALMRQIIMSQIMDEIYVKLDDLNWIQKWIELFLEFELHQANIVANMSNKNILEKLHNQLNRLLVYLRTQKWKITKELELKQTLNTIKSLINRNFPPQTPTSTGDLSAKRRLNQSEMCVSLASRKVKRI